jgi:hypothetical protein
VVDTLLAVRDDHVFEQRLDPLIVQELLAAIIVFGGIARDFHEDNRVEQARRLVIFVGPFAAGHAHVRIGVQGS